MPIYEYSCAKKHITEQFYPSYDLSEEKIKCPVCKKQAERIVSMPGDTIFVGEGFYKPSASKTKYNKDKEKFTKK
jgi:putative FmdB family regulatory protein